MIWTDECEQNEQIAKMNQLLKTSTKRDSGSSSVSVFCTNYGQKLQNSTFLLLFFSFFLVFFPFFLDFLYWTPIFHDCPPFSCFRISQVLFSSVFLFSWIAPRSNLSQVVIHCSLNCVKVTFRGPQPDFQSFFPAFEFFRRSYRRFPSFFPRSLFTSRRVCDHFRRRLCRVVEFGVMHR